MSYPHRSPASLQDVGKDPDVPTPKKQVAPRTALLLSALFAVTATAFFAFVYVGTHTAAVQEAAPAQTVQAVAPAQWQAPGPGEAAVKRSILTDQEKANRAASDKPLQSAVRGH